MLMLLLAIIGFKQNSLFMKLVAPDITVSFDMIVIDSFVL